jgi:hypothetical protein
VEGETMNRNTIVFIIGCSLLLLSILIPFLMGEFNYIGIRVAERPAPPIWETELTAILSIMGISLITLTSLSGEEFLPFVRTEVNP